MQKIELRLRLAKQHGPKQFSLDRAARYVCDSEQHFTYRQLADPGFLVFLKVNNRASSCLTVAKQVIKTQTVKTLLSKADRNGNLQHSSKRKQHTTRPTEWHLCMGNRIPATETRHVRRRGSCDISNGKTEAQPVHCDIRDGSHLWRDDPPLSGIIALEDSTVLLVIPDSLESYECAFETVTLDAGNVLVIYALVVHAGAGYSKATRRMHFTALTPSCKSRPGNETYVVVGYSVSEV
jgi:hypothetical protein